MKVRRFDDAAAFLEAAGAFLCGDEAAHALLIGIASELQDVAERDDEPAPYLAAVMDHPRVMATALMTPPRGPVLSLVDDPAALPLLAQDLQILYPTLPTALGPTAVVRDFAHVWRHLSGQRARLVRAERVFQLDRVCPLRDVPGRLQRATVDDRALVEDWVRAFAREAMGEDDSATVRDVVGRLSSMSGGLYLWHNGGPVSLIGYAGPTPHGIRIGPVYTPPSLRGQGYASAGVAAVSQRLLEEGRRWCFLHTDVANPTTQHLYQAIGYRPVCDLEAYTFDQTTDVGNADGAITTTAPRT